MDIAESGKIIVDHLLKETARMRREEAIGATVKALKKSALEAALFQWLDGSVKRLLTDHAVYHWQDTPGYWVEDWRYRERGAAWDEGTAL